MSFSNNNNNNNHIFKDAKLRVVCVTGNKSPACWNYNSERIKGPGRRYVQYIPIIQDPFLFTLNEKKRLLILSCMSVCPTALNKSAVTAQILIEFYVSVFFENLSRKFKIR